MSAKPTTDNEADYMQGLVAAAHELKTPLSIISHLASALESDQLMDSAMRQEALQRIQLSADRTQRLVRGLTTSYRLHNQLGFELKLQPVNMTQVCEEVAHEIAPFASAQKQRLELAIGQKSQLVVGDRELLHSIVFNLLDNALRHTPPQTAVQLQMRRRDTRVRVCVHDDGPGLRPSDVHQLATRLGKQVQPIMTRSSGSGLGLYIASQLAVAMGGQIGIGRVAEGADFHVDLQCSRQLSLL